MKIWFKEYKKSKMIRDCEIEDNGNETRTHKIFNSLEEASHKLDIAVPIWLDSNISEFKRSAKTRFSKDSFVEDIDFDFLEMMVTEEDFR